MAGLDAKHRHILDQMKKEISEKNELASREANKVRCPRHAHAKSSLFSCQHAPTPPRCVHQTHMRGCKTPG